MTDWRSADPPWQPVTPAGWVRVLLKGATLGAVTYGGLALLLLVRLFEAPLFSPARPVTPFITQGVCRAAFVILGIRLAIRGRAMPKKGALVANHASWLDIFALNAAARVYFVAKSEVERWAGIGWLARATGTVFIARKGAEAKAQQTVFEQRLRAGHRLAFFPEGTSTDAIRVLPFKSTLFEAFFAVGDLHLQPVTLVYHAPKGADPRFYGWWGDMAFAGHLLAMLAAPRHGRVEVIFHPPLAVADHAGRKSLAAACEAAVRSGLPAALPQPDLRPAGPATPSWP